MVRGTILGLLNGELVFRLLAKRRGQYASLNGEWVIALHRLLAGVLTILVVVHAAKPDSAALSTSMALGTCYLVLGLAFVFHVRVRPEPSALRRLLGMALDVLGLSCALHIGGEGASLLYPAYLWMIFGNGFRFGNLCLFAASALSIFGFGVVVATTPFWQDLPDLSASLVIALIVLPGYASMLIAGLQNARRAAEEASRAKTLFLASVSHELRTPLNAIVGMGDLLGATQLDAEQAGMVSTIGTSAGVLLGLIEDLLGFSRIEAGQIKVTPTAFDLGRLLAEVQGMISAQARAKGLLANTYVTARTPQRLRGDAQHLRQILLNLCSNAIKFTDEGSVTIAADIAVADPTEQAGLVRLRVEVADTGIGIAPEAQERVFEMFTQADETVMNRYGGTGLGLAIVDRLVRRLGGRVGIESGVGQGSTFWVEIEVEIARDDSLAAIANFPPGRVVAVSSDPARAALLAACAARLGADVATASALDALVGTDPCVVLLDASGATFTPVDTGLIGFPLVAVGSVLAEGLPLREFRERFATAIQDQGPAEELRNALHIAATHLPGGDQAAPVPVPTPVAAQRPLRVLVADDNPVNRLVTNKALERAGHTIVLASDGEQALEALASEAVDVALMDVNMPVLNGIEAAQLYQVSSPGNGRRVPLIGLTADASAETAQRCLDAGMAACLVKPVRARELLRAVEEAALAAGASPSRVTAIAAHPRYRAAQPAPVDGQALADLAALGGEAFVARVVGEFVADAETVIVNLEHAAAARDVHRFRAEAHALCSSAANLGATALRAVCDPWQRISLSELADFGPDLVDRLHHEWRRTRAGLDEAVGAKALPVPLSRSP